MTGQKGILLEVLEAEGEAGAKLQGWDTMCRAGGGE